eukprot:9085113-Pyramimonas_sp.AAC.1
MNAKRAGGMASEIGPLPPGPKARGTRPRALRKGRKDTRFAMLCHAFSRGRCRGHQHDPPRYRQLMKLTPGEMLRRANG